MFPIFEITIQLIMDDEMINMKGTKKNGAKRNPILALAILGLLVGAGATGAFAAGLVPSLDTGVSGSVTATVNTVPLLTIAHAGGADVFKAYNSDNKAVKFTSALTIEAPGSNTINVSVTVNKIVSPANAIIINMDGMSDYVRTDLNISANGQTAVRLGSGEWAIDGSGANTPFAVGDVVVLTFTIYVSQQTAGVPLNNVWDFTITEGNI